MKLDVLIILVGPFVLLAFPWLGWRRARTRSHPNPRSVGLMVLGVEMMVASAVLFALRTGWLSLYFLVLGAGWLYTGWVLGRADARGCRR
jgi:hypothetical protein